MKKFTLFITAIFFFNFGFSQETRQFSLEEAILFAVKNAYAAKNATNDVEAARKKVWETTTIGLPQLSAAVDYQNYLKQPIALIPAEFFGGNPDEFAEISFGTKQNLVGSVTLNQLLFDGSFLVGLQSAKTYLKISESAKTKTEIAIKIATINAYVNVLLAEDNTKILTKNKALLIENVTQTKALLANGLVESQQLEQLQITLSTLEIQLNKTNRMKDLDFKMLNFILGINIDSKLKLTDNFESLLLQNIQLELITNPFDVENHIDYQIVFNNKRANELMVKFEKSKALPSISAFLNYKQTADNDQFKFFRTEQKWFESSLLGVSINVPVFSSLRRSAQTQQAEINLEKANRQLIEKSEELKLAHQKSVSNYQFSIDQFNTSKENLQLAERIERKETIKFFEGIGSSFDLTNAQNQLYNAQQNYLQSIYEIITSKAALEAALNNL
ncbi:MAG: TolC family protein [Flavobacteriaceae bacterium]|nr:TolC family protein [Flavobacteriaceae bacterium]